jgi:hypothetical protein
VLGLVGGALTGVMAATAPSPWRHVVEVDAVVSWLAAILLVARPRTSLLWRRTAWCWTLTLPAAYAVAALGQWASP